MLGVGNLPQAVAPQDRDPDAVQQADPARLKVPIRGSDRRDPSEGGT
jgi:hypothetical protein